MTEAEIKKVMALGGPVGRVLGRSLALPRKYVQELLARLALAAETEASEQTGRAADAVGALRDILRKARDHPSPCVCETPDGEEIFAFEPLAFPVKSRSATLSALCDELILPRMLEEVRAGAPAESTKKGEYEAALSKLVKQEAALKEEGARLRELASAALQATTVEEARALVDKAQPGGSRRPPSSTAAAASMIFNRAKEIEGEAEDVRGAIRKLSRKSSKEVVSGRKATRELKKGASHEWFEKFRWFYTSEGKLAVGGRDAQTNTILVKRHMQPKDTVYHADLFGSPFFVVKGGADQTPQEIVEVAQATASFSSAWKTGLGVADAYWVHPDQVGTSAPSGEYLARGSFMIKGKRNAVPNNVVQVCVGVDRQGRLVAGPEGAISKHSNNYVVVAPHREKASDTAKSIAAALGIRESYPAISLDDVLRALPAGGGKLVRKRTASL